MTIPASLRVSFSAVLPAHAIAASISDDDLTADYIVPSVFDRGVAPAVAAAVARAAQDTGVARRQRSVASA
jgi:malate dehydrogenase (oxaloacetate-decarboxylating)